MRIIQNKNHKNIYIIIIIFALVLSGGVAAALLIPASPFSINRDSADQPENTVNYDKPTDEQKAAGDRAKEDFIKDHEETDATGPAVSDATSDVGVSITTLSQQGSILQIRTIIEINNEEGDCTMTLSRPGYESLVSTVQVQSQGSYSVCKGFDADVLSLDRGAWSVKIDYVAGDSSGTAQKDVTLQ